MLSPDDANLTRPVVISRVSPNYTPAAHAAGIEGEVRLIGVVQPDGSVDDIRIVESLDAEHGLDEKARMAVGRWRFEPGRRNGVAAPVQVDIVVAFSLEQQRTVIHANTSALLVPRELSATRVSPAAVGGFARANGMRFVDRTDGEPLAYLNNSPA